ncbi:hypothetical protein YC2023_051841 [Brassica napus]
MDNRFAAEDFTDDQKMALAYAVIRGEDESWYNNRVSRRPFQNWKDLKDAMLLRGGGGGRIEARGQRTEDRGQRTEQDEFSS